MTIVEVIDAKNQNQPEEEEITMRINWLPDGKNIVIRSHGMGYKSLRDWYKKELKEPMALDVPQLYESYFKTHFGYDFDFIQYR